MDAVAEDIVAGMPNEPKPAGDEAAAEIRAALRLTRRAAESELWLARGMRQRLRRVWNALLRGSIDRRRASVLIRETIHLDRTDARRLVDRIVDDAHRLTTGDLRARIRKLCVEINPDEVRDRLLRAHDERRLIDEPLTDGTANLLGLNLNPNSVVAAQRRINEIATSPRTDGEHRTMEQLRADVYIDRLCGKRTGGKGATADIRVDLETFAKLNDHSGDLAGYGPVIGEIARDVADRQTDADWRCTVIDPGSGRPIVAGIARRRPTAKQRRLVEMTRTACVLPGCRIPAAQCDLDHRVEWVNGGPATVENLAPLCRNDLWIRHKAGWGYEILPNGEVDWTSPLSHRYVTSCRDP